MNNLGIKEEIEEKPALSSIRFASIMLHQVLRKGHVLGVLLLHLAVAPWQGLVVYHFSVLVVLLAEWSLWSKEGNRVNSLETCKEEPGNEKSMSSLLTKLLFRPSIESIEGRDTREEEEHWHLPDIHEDNPTRKKPSKIK